MTQTTLSPFEPVKWSGVFSLFPLCTSSVLTAPFFFSLPPSVLPSCLYHSLQHPHPPSFLSAAHITPPSTLSSQFSALIRFFPPSPFHSLTSPPSIANSPLSFVLLFSPPQSPPFPQLLPLISFLSPPCCSPYSFVSLPSTLWSPLGQILPSLPLIRPGSN